MGIQLQFKNEGYRGIIVANDLSIFLISQHNRQMTLSN